MSTITPSPSVARNILQLEIDRDEAAKRSIELVKLIQTEKRDFTPAEESEFNTVEETVANYNERINKLKRDSLIEAGANDYRRSIDGTSRGRDFFEPEGRSVLLTAGEYAKLATEQRALGKVAAGVLLPLEQSTEWFDRLRARSVFLAAGPKITPVHSASMRLPLVTASISVGARDDLSEIAASDPSLDYRILEPVSYAALANIDNAVLSESDGKALEIVTSDMVSQATTVLDGQFFNSTGAASGPTHRMTGLLKVTGTQSIAGGSSPLTLDMISMAIAALEGANANRDRSAFFFHPTQWAQLRTLKDQSGKYMISPDLSSAEQPRLWGIPAYVSSNIPAGNALAVDLDQVVVGVGQEITLAYSEHARFTFDQTAVRLTTRVDLAVLNLLGIVKITGLTS